jgi:hypothetical protein
VVDAIDGPAADTDDPSVDDADVERAPVRAQHARRLDPAHLLLGDAGVQLDVDAFRPTRPRGMGRSRPPRVLYPVAHSTSLAGYARVDRR